MLESIIIPQSIVVHLGSPSSNAQNVRVSFIDYCKNVASSEIFPTWPIEALKANIYAQMSLVLNRIYTQWYPNQGYDFDITNSTAFDQAFVYQRNIYESVAVIVEELIGSYLQFPFYREPYYSEYCDGRIASCPGMKQWGTLDLAQRGYNAQAILKYYYGDILQFQFTSNVQEIMPSFPGTLQLGSVGEGVFIVQELLNGVAVNFPSIPLIYPPDGVFNSVTQEAVTAFQEIFDLTSDGIVGRQTWAELSRRYVAVRNLAQLNSLGRLEGYFTGLWVNRTLKNGIRGILVHQLQYFFIVISENDPRITPPTLDSVFGNRTTQSVIDFQNAYDLAPDGIVGIATWNKIVSVFKMYRNELRTI